MILYTANIGHKDRLQEPKATFDGIEYVYFVDNKEGYESDVWDFREVPRKFKDTRMDAKWYKMHPHLLFPGEDTIWIDSIYIPMRSNPINHFKLGDFVLYTHGTGRDCLYDEAAFCVRKGAGNRADIERQVAEYRAQLMPEHFGLYEGNVLCRTPELGVFNELWWEQVQEFSVRDQISLPYLLWKHNIEVASLPGANKYRRFFKGGRHIFHGTKEDL